MSENARAIVLRSRPFSETSLIVNWLCAEQGRVSTVAKGALRPQSPFRGKLDLFYEANISFARSSRSDLHTLREVSVTNVNGALRNDLQLLRQAAYCANLIEVSTETDAPITGLFELFRGFLYHIGSKTMVQPRNVLAFELKCLQELGMAPDIADARLTPGAKGLLQSLAQADWTELSGLTPLKTEAAEVRQFLHGFLVYHLGRLPKGREGALALN